MAQGLGVQGNKAEDLCPISEPTWEKKRTSGLHACQGMHMNTKPVSPTIHTMHSTHTVHTKDTTSSERLLGAINTINKRQIISGEENLFHCNSEPGFSVHIIGTSLPTQSLQQRAVPSQEVAQLSLK